MYISVLSLEIQLSEEAVLVSIDRFNPVTFLFPSQARTWTSIVRCRVFYVQWFGVGGGCLFC